MKAIKHREALKNSYEDGLRVDRRGDTVTAELLYPPYDNDPALNKVRYIEVAMESVRAADGLRLWFSFDRDGWVVEQAQVFEWSSDDQTCDPEWKEVGFFRSFACQRCQTGD